MNKILFLFVFLAMASTAHAQIQDFTLIEDFPNQIYAGNTIHAIYSILVTEPTQATIIFTLELQQNITPRLSEFPTRTILLDNTTLNCTEQIFDKGFSLNCSANLTNNHNPIIFLTTAPNMAPDTFDYSLTVSPMVDLPLPKPSIPPTPTSFSTGGRGLNIDLPITLNTTVIYLSHLENISYEKYKYQPLKEIGGIIIYDNYVPTQNDTNNLTITVSLGELDNQHKHLPWIMLLLSYILFCLFYPKIKERFKKRETIERNCAYCGKKGAKERANGLYYCDIHKNRVSGSMKGENGC